VLNGPPDPPIALTFVGNQMEPLPLDEIGIAQLFQRILDPNPTRIKGISLTKKSFLQVAQELAQAGRLLLLQENTRPLWDYLDTLKNQDLDFESIAFILGDSLDLKKEEEELLLNDLGALPVSFGLHSYLASHCIIFTLMELKKINFT
jgi:tRNA pseudouridine-54 N-methylase